MPWGGGVACGKRLMRALFFFLGDYFFYTWSTLFVCAVFCHPFQDGRASPRGAGSVGPSPADPQVASPASQKSPAGFDVLPATFPSPACIAFCSLFNFQWYAVTSVSFYDGILIPLCSQESFPLAFLAPPSTPPALGAFRGHAAYLRDSRRSAQK